MSEEMAGTQVESTEAAAGAAGIDTGAGLAAAAAQGSALPSGQAKAEAGAAPQEGFGKSLLAASDKKSAESPAVVPEKYDLKLPEGLSFGKEQLDAFQRQARELGLSNQGAQKLLDNAHRNIKATREARMGEIKGWEDAVRTDKEIGGDNFDASVNHAAAAVRQFDQENVIFKMLEDTGYGCHPEVIRFLSRVGKALGEDKVHTGKGVNPALPLEERLYPDWNVKG